MIGVELSRLLAALRCPLPAPALGARVACLERSAWPSVAACWSRLTPTGFPVEVTVADDAPRLCWSAEIAPPEVSESDRLRLVAREMAAHGQPIDAGAQARLQALQDRAELRFGAWLGGREEAHAPPRFKLYAELPEQVDIDALPVPGALRQACRHVRSGTRARMLGIEPARGRTEIYLRLPASDIESLLPLASAVGQPNALAALDRHLPDGRRRLAGRRLGASLAWSAGAGFEIAIFVSARTLFPGAPELLHRLAPKSRAIEAVRGRHGLVSIGLDPAGASLRLAVGLAPACPARRRRP
ncbi:MAG: hypothetical protein QM766_09085 [Burkholderiaceae bacterium]